MTTSGSASPSAPLVPARSAFDILADELGAVAAQVERSVELRVSVIVAELARKDSERELALHKFMQEVKDRVDTVLSTVRSGVDGKDGAPGRDGIDGKDGAPGKDGKDGSNGEKGDKGDPGEKGQEGPPGLPGERGADGRDGNDGQKGEPGDTGPQGERGADGPVGERGVAGEVGAKGEPGDPGPQGERGLQGLPGKLPRVVRWVEGVHYACDVVHHDGQLYQATKDTGTEPGSSDDWECLTMRGVDGKDAKSFVIRGTYSPAKTYAPLDVVACNGGSFVALKDNAGICPGPDWQLLAGPGKRGDKGQPGGSGPAGKDGKNASTETIVGWINDAEQYKATPVMSDGSKGPALDVRVFLEQFMKEVKEI